MKKWFFLLVILAIFFGLGWLLRVDGYINALLAIRELPRPLWGQAYGQMMRTEGGERGIVARVVGNKVWVWRGGWVEQVQVDQDTVYSYWQACKGLVSIEELQRAKIREIGREVTSSLAEWGKWIKPGDVMDIYLASDREDSVAREIYGYDWRLYLPLPATLEMQCRR